MASKLFGSFMFRKLCRNFSVARCEPGNELLSKEIEESVNQQIATEMNASFNYLAMSCYFGRLTVALPGCSGFFQKMFLEEQEHANRFIKYLLMRGGNVKLLAVTVPDMQEWDGVAKAFDCSFKMEKTIKKSLEKLYCIAEKARDLQTMDFVGSTFIEEQNESIGEMGRLYTRASNMIKDKTGEFLFDKELFEVFVKGKGDGYK